MQNDTLLVDTEFMSKTNSTKSSQNYTVPLRKMGITKQLTILCKDKSSWNKSNKDLLTRITGRFYTPILIANHLIDSIVLNKNILKLDTIKVIDPFCGDGRLIYWLIKHVSLNFPNAKRKWEVDLWDCDIDAVTFARQNLDSLNVDFNNAISVNANHVDSFEVSSDFQSYYDICITNPPWEILKPDAREIDDLSNLDQKKYINLLREKDTFLRKSYPLSSPNKRFSGWGMNLARCGVEAAIRLTKPGGVCAIVSPASLLADQQSVDLRQWLFNKCSVSDIAYFAAEARLFDAVDQPCITITLSPGLAAKSVPTIKIFDKKRIGESIKLSIHDWATIAENKYTIPLQFGISLIKLSGKWSELPKFTELENKLDVLWAGRELDETRHEEYLTDMGDYLFVKGRMIKRFGMVEKPTKFVKTDGPRIPKTANYARIVWRDVARPTQKRRMHATIIPAGYVSGNSLNVAYYKNGSLNELNALLGVMNSFVFEAQVRMFLATAHVSLGAIRQAKIPSFKIQSEIDLISSLVSKCLNNDSPTDIAILEIQIAKLYGFSKEEFALLLSSFDKLDEQEKSLLLSDIYWSASYC